MALKETLTPLKATNNATYKTVEGVTYFKLKSEFEGDYTKHCGLLGEEIDENFYFLRGYDIEDIIVDENRNLIIKRVDKNYAPIIVNIGEELEQPKFDFDKNTGIVTVYYPDGTKSEMEGFLVEGKDIRIATDSTFNGNGTVYNPLRLSPVEKTGTFSPANEYFDLTNVDNMSQMPEGKGKGYRIVTKEKIDNFGCLYPFSAVKKIQKELEESGSQWRVPSKKDWDELLNALECAEDRNHSAITCTWLGKVAGSGLKSAKLWNDFQTLPTEIPTNGQDVCGLSVYPVGITPDRNAIINDKNYDAEGFGQIAGMWTTTVNDEGNAYVKVFGYNSTKVDQDTYGDGARMSIRLVKEYNSNNFNKIENILGFPYPTELVYGIHDDYQYVKIWTKINLYSDAESLGGIRSEEWASVTDSDKGVKTVYFINEWDGTDWHKKLMNDGDSVIIINYEDKPYHEWRIINGELVDTVEAIVEEVKKDIYNLSATTNELVTFCGWTVNTINEFSTATEEHINRIDENVNTEINNRKESDEKLLESIRKESELRDSVDKQLRESIIAEGEQRKKSDDEILTALQSESELRKSVDEQLHTAIVSEGEQRKKSDDEILLALQQESENREDADATLLNAIQNETSNRETADADILSKIDAEKTAREGAVIEINSNVSALSERISVEEQVRLSKDNELDVKINTLSGNVETSISNVVNEFNNKKVNDVVYDNGNKVIKLIFADGSYSEGFDASEFVVDGMLDGVTFDQNTNEIKFVWNTSAGKTEFVVPLDKFVDQYSVADDSISFLKISDDNKVSAIVDGGNGFANTLATTDFVKDYVNKGVNTVREEITNYIDAQDEVISNKIDVLNGDANTVGSVSYTVKKKFNDAILTDGAPITSTSIEEANKVHSLVRKIDVNGEYIYFVSSDASDMYYESKNGEVKLADYITSMEDKNVELENRVKELEDRLANLGNDIEGTIKDIIKSYIVGTENEIKVIENENKLKIGFDDNAIFGKM